MNVKCLYKWYNDGGLQLVKIIHRERSHSIQLADMIRNYIRIAWRNITRSRFYALVNIIGLSAGIAFTMIIGAFIWGEYQVNSQLKNTDRQYIIQSDWKDGSQGFGLAIFGPLAKELKENYPNLVANYYRFDGVTSSVTKGDKGFREPISIGDTTILGMYGFTLQHGDAATAFKDPFSVVMTQEKALKYFGRTDVVGETITIENFSGSKHPFTITGILDKTARNSVTRLTDENDNQIIVPATNISYFGRNMDWSNAWIANYIELQKGVTPQQLKGPIDHLIKQNAPPQFLGKVKPILTSLHDFHFTYNNGLVRKMIYALSAIALFILLMAVINFVNMSVSRSASRMKEIGVRKVLGGMRSQLIMQFLVESILLVSFAALFAIVLYICTKQVFSQALGKDLPSLAAFPVYFVGVLILGILVIGMLAGIYPAFVLSSLKSVESLKGKLTSVKENIFFRKSLVAFQFGTAIVVFAGAIIIAKQINYFFSKQLGYDKEYMLAAQVPRNWTPEGVNKMQNISKQFATLPQVANVSLSYEIPDGNNGGGIALYNKGGDPKSAVPSMLLMTDEHYAATYNIPMAAGQFFCRPGAPFTDTATAVINETQSKALGFKTPQDALGRQLVWGDGATPVTITGVIKDFHFESMQKAVRPLSFFHVEWTKTYRYLSFKIKPGNTVAAVEALQKQWAALMPGSPFEYKFMDETLKFLYRSEIQLRQASYTATSLALIIVLLGILGLVSLSIQKRTKEIGIRKVLGSSIQGIVLLFIKDFLPVMLISAVVACPLAWLLMKQWLSDYAYRIDITATPFVVTIALLGIVTTVLIFLQTIRAALSNPVKSIRTE